MRSKKDRGGSQIIVLIIFAVIFIINIFGIWGLLVALIIGFSALSFWLSEKAKRGGQTRGAERGRAGERLDTEAGRADVRYSREDDLRRRQDLEDLLKAGIIEQDEYLDKIEQLRKGGY